MLRPSGVAPQSILPEPGLEHLIGVEIGVLAEQSVAERRDQAFARVPEQDMAGDQAGARIDLLLPVERVQQRAADRVVVCGQIVQRLATRPAGARAAGSGSA